MKKTILIISALATFASADIFDNTARQDFNQQDVPVVKSKLDQVNMNLAKTSLKIDSKPISCTTDKSVINFSTNYSDFYSILKTQKYNRDFKTTLTQNVFYPMCSDFAEKMTSSNFSRTLDTTAGYKMNLTTASYCNAFIVNNFQIPADMYELNLFFANLIDIQDKDLAFAKIKNLVSTHGYKLYADPTYFLKFALDNNLFAKQEFAEYIEKMVSRNGVEEFVKQTNENYDKPKNICFKPIVKKLYGNEFYDAYFNKAQYIALTQNRSCEPINKVAKQFEVGEDKEDMLFTLTSKDGTNNLKEDFHFEGFKYKGGDIGLALYKDNDEDVLMVFESLETCKNLVSQLKN